MINAPETFQRVSLRERVQQILIGVAFCLLGVTGLPQKFSSLDWAKMLVNLLGGIEIVRAIHHLAAILLIGVGVYHLVSGSYRRLVNGARMNRSNYMDKFAYWMIVWTVSVMTLTGLILWFPLFFTNFLPGIFVPAAKSVHDGQALLTFAVIVLYLYSKARYSLSHSDEPIASA